MPEPAPVPKADPTTTAVEPRGVAATAQPAQPYAAPGANAARPYNTWAIVSICFAGSTVIGAWCMGGLIAVITGHVARHQIRRTGEAGDGIALAGLIVGYVSIGLTLAVVLVYLMFLFFVFALAVSHGSPHTSPAP